uniref:CHHC U11-48K-type domain-containing protein n=1 Tax=Oncorhynchus kisutch TaxID=8019 RepID=A0A8C7FVB2_ONCKI
MSTIRFGSTCSPSKTTLAETLPRWNDEEGEKADPEDACDPNKLLQCPYDKNHQIRACRFPYHLIKCSKNHPKLASELKTCPFNARHLMPKHELSHHIANCVDRISVNAEDLGSAEVQSKWQVPVSTWTNTNCDEDWDKGTLSQTADYACVLNAKMPCMHLFVSQLLHTPWTDAVNATFQIFMLEIFH